MDQNGVLIGGLASTGARHGSEDLVVLAARPPGRPRNWFPPPSWKSVPDTATPQPHSLTSSPRASLGSRPTTTRADRSMACIAVTGAWSAENSTWKQRHSQEVTHGDREGGR